MKNNRGFTLIELLVVTAIIVMLATLFFPKIDDLLPRTLLKTTGRRLAINIRYLAQLAILKQTSYRLYLDKETNTYWSTLLTDGEEKKISSRLINQKRLPSGLIFSKMEQPASFRDKDDSFYIEFLPSGEVEETLIVIASEEPRRKLTLIVHSYGGRTEIKEETEESLL